MISDKNSAENIAETANITPTIEHDVKICYDHNVVRFEMTNIGQKVIEFSKKIKTITDTVLSNEDLTTAKVDYHKAVAVELDKIHQRTAVFQKYLEAISKEFPKGIRVAKDMPEQACNVCQLKYIKGDRFEFGCKPYTTAAPTALVIEPSEVKSPSMVTLSSSMNYNNIERDASDRE